MSDPLDFGNLNVGLAKQVGYLEYDLGFFKKKKHDILELIDKQPFDSILHRIKEILQNET